MTDIEPIVGTSSQLEVEIPIKSNDIALPLQRSSRVSVPPEFCGFHLTVEGDTLISDKTLINLDNPNSY